MTNEIVVRNAGLVTTYDEVERVAKAMAASGFFQDAKSISQAIVKIMAGSEIGFGPFASMQGVNIIQGRPSYNANMLASSVKASGKYNYRIVALTDDKCDLAFFENGQEVGHSTFTLADAKRAGTKNLEKFPRNMLFARAMSNGVRWYCPDVTNGNAVYTPEELGADVDEDGNVINMEPNGVTITVTEPDPEPDPIDDAIEAAGPAAIMTLDEAVNVTNSEGEFYGQLSSEKLAAMTIGINRGLKKPDVTDEQRETYSMKLSAIRTILQAREDGTLAS
jgi:hypothetical protein